MAKHAVPLAKIHDRFAVEVAEVLDRFDGHLTDGELIALLARIVGVIVHTKGLNEPVCAQMLLDNMAEGVRFAHACHVEDIKNALGLGGL